MLESSRTHREEEEDEEEERKRGKKAEQNVRQTADQKQTEAEELVNTTTQDQAETWLHFKGAVCSFGEEI